MLQSGFSFFRSIRWFDVKKVDLSSKQDVAPSPSILLDKEIYRPDDLVTATVEICSPKVSNGYTDGGNWNNKASSFLIDNFSFEVKGIEKLNSQWFSTQKPLPRLKQRREREIHLTVTLILSLSIGHCNSENIKNLIKTMILLTRSGEGR